MIVNVVCFSCKHNDELQATYAYGIANLIANDEIEIGKRINQIIHYKDLEILDGVLIYILYAIFYTCIV
ncbi:hypothetical protein L6164_028430 [Bauhinia variegata]|uniref:Uncharacterized protein n=1 Tax=Bauhinia variegata TaxID=167791 RepID=A0ACB9L650_BAUVA|nr:hypothetical protein L6164_028430 [Bauhinia variegata]